MKIISGSKTKLEESIANKFIQIINNKSNAKFLLATGNSQVEIYKNLVDYYQQNIVSFANVITFNLDEYLQAEKYYTDSFSNFMKNKLFDYIDIKKENIFFPQEVKEYNKKLDQIDYFDLTILGVGENGHIAFNEPGSKITDRTKIVNLTASTIQANFKNRTDYPKQAITIGIRDILKKSKLIYVVAWGEKKRKSVEKLLEKEITSDWPITYLLKNKNVILFTDLEI
ncbi:/ nagB_2 / Glucosamine-6-phosphate deaminase / 6681:7361 Forward [Candidatus Hepatoplasma crinochetorum]|uniref:/ nagB_2 / Glucosamine-6-phosphate deaminase / 6681:7361 Forward n=1 Tax=Candidatus Hepatoplasma crinochetorum TaxID=295596 RepID=A0A0G7ZLW5_9MOLU|nr:/ nagB_2 / Glucosamine-6-phosphate deaminase / 6681:7361 Forward [Candidatus Hepatoplasma crinochetorum]